MNIGDKVNHNRYGQGTLQQLIIVKGEQQALVTFEHGGNQWVITPAQRLSEAPQAEAQEPSVIGNKQTGVAIHKGLAGHKPLAQNKPLALNRPLALASKPTMPAQKKADKYQKSRRGFLASLAGLFAAAPLLAISQPKHSAIKVVPILETRIAGFAHYKGSQHLNRISVGDKLRLQREASNSHDSKAVEVFWQQHKIGYIPKSHNAALSKLLDNGEIVAASVAKIQQRPWEPLDLSLYLQVNA